jgi:hypothetical protein
LGKESKHQPGNSRLRYQPKGWSDKPSTLPWCRTLLRFSPVLVEKVRSSSPQDFDKIHIFTLLNHVNQILPVPEIVALSWGNTNSFSSCYTQFVPESRGAVMLAK